MKTLIKEVGKQPIVKDIDNNLETIQTIVGGYIEAVMLPDNVVLICNEEGKLQGLKPNFRLANDVIVGNVLFVSSSGEEFADLNDTQIEWLKKNLEE